MRIVAGSLRGKAIDAPSGSNTRPTTDRVREALFSSLFSQRGGFEGAIVLDAFAGSGALGLEALSRGAQSCTFYERDAKACGVLRRNVKSCALSSQQALVVQRDVMLSPPRPGHAPFDLVFLDPPYAYEPEGILGMVATLHAEGTVSDDALIVYEHALASKDELLAAASHNGFSARTHKKYGKTGVSILEIAIHS